MSDPRIDLLFCKPMILGFFYSLSEIVHLCFLKLIFIKLRIFCGSIILCIVYILPYYGKIKFAFCII